MLFNSFEFFIFLPIVLGLYLFLPLRGQNAWLLVASYVFYGSWDWRFLGLILVSTGVDYVVQVEAYRASILFGPRNGAAFYVTKTQAPFCLEHLVASGFQRGVQDADEADEDDEGGSYQDQDV